MRLDRGHAQCRGRNNNFRFRSQALLVPSPPMSLSRLTIEALVPRQEEEEEEE